MSKIVAYREKVVEAIREKVPDLINVDWYDGLFDEEDVIEWGGSAPAAYVACLNVKTTPHTTGELLSDTQVVVVVVTQDTGQAREADAENWTFLEAIATLAHQNTFGDPNASLPEGLDFKRLRHPQLRREGVALGVVEWTTDLTIGTHRTNRRDIPRDLQGRTYPFPDRLTARARLGGAPAGTEDIASTE